MQSVTSNAVARAINGFIKSYDVDYGDITVTSNNYMSLPEILPNKTIIGYNLKHWSQNSGCFSLQIYHPTATRNAPYFIADNGVTITQFRVTYYYID